MLAIEGMRASDQNDNSKRQGGEMILGTIRRFVFVFLVLVPFAAMAQGPSPSSNPPTTTSDQLLKPAELDALVAPIALYPDPLLAEVLMASTYPLEVVQAERWATKNKNLKGDQLKAAADKQPWDGSIKALVATPSVLEMMSSHLDWTEKLGNAVLAQQADVMDAVQRLRAKAQANNKLTTTKEQTVTVRQEQNRQMVVIEPTDPETIYVPYYDPAVVYGEWPYADYPAYYFPPPPYLGYGILATGLAFGAAYALGRWRSGGNYWGGGINWNRNNINVNRPVNINNIGNNWQHNPAHRRGVKYANTNVQQRFGGNNRGPGLGNRVPATRPGVGNLPANRPGAGNLPANRPGAGNRPANRPSAGNRPANRPSAGTRPANRPSARPRPASRPSVARRPSVGARPSFGGGGRGGFAARGGGGFRGGGGGFRGGGGRGGGRRSDILLKHDITLLGRLDNGLGFYRFSYNGSDKTYVGVMAQEVQAVAPEAVTRGRDGYLRVFYGKLGVPFQTYDHWIESGARIPATANIRH